MDLIFGAAVFEVSGQMHKLCLSVYRLRSQISGHIDILLFLPPPQPPNSTSNHGKRSGMLLSRAYARGKFFVTPFTLPLPPHLPIPLTFRKVYGLEVNADKTKYMVMSRDQNAGRNHSVRIDNSTFERVEEFKYLGTILTNQNSIPEEIKSRLRSGNAWYHTVQNLLSSRLLYNLKIKIYRTIILPVVL